jgi:hypothetical protein
VLADESKDTASDRRTVASSIAINAIPNFIDIASFWFIVLQTEVFNHEMPLQVGCVVR